MATKKKKNGSKNKVIKKTKTVTKNIKEKLSKTWKKDPISILVPGISIVVLILMTIKLGFILSFIILGIINGIYFYLNRKKKNDIKKDSLKKNEKKDNTKKNIKKKKKSKLKILLLILLWMFIAGILAIIAFFAYIAIQAPEFNEELLYLTDPSVILDKDGNEVAKLGAEQRILIDYDALPEVLVDAIVATEDSRFFDHNGVDWARFIKASLYQLAGKSSAGGASTLTMQVSKNAYTSKEASGIKGIIRKFTDIYVAQFIIEKNYSKEQIMSFYVNSQWLGKNSYGVEQACRTFFGKSAKDLNLSEAAFIAGLFQAPGKYDPFKNPEAAENRRLMVLKRLLRHGYITKDEYNIAKKMTIDKIIINQEDSQYNNTEFNKYQAYIDAVVDEVKEDTGESPYTTPMTIYTTLNTDFQDYLNGIMNGESYAWIDEKAQAGIVVLNVKDGSVAAIGSGRNLNAVGTYNYAVDTNVQIGSTAKPLYDYGPAIEYDNANTYGPVVDEPTTYSDGTTISNWNNTYEGFETYRVALAGSRNIPALKVFKKNNKQQVIEFVTKLGLTPEIYSCNEGYKLDGKNCINQKDPNKVVKANQAKTLHEAHAIGGYNGESPLTMAAAYAAFGNKGTYNSPHTYTKIIYNDSKEEVNKAITTTKAMGEDTAYMVSSMLQSTAEQALGSATANVNGTKIAAKTGTTNYDEKLLAKKGLLGRDIINDLWVVGYNTEYAVSVWYGYDKIDPNYYSRVARPAHTNIFKIVARKVFTNKTDFYRPSNVVSVEIENGAAEAMLPSEFTPGDLRITELFKKGYEPTTVSPRFAKLGDISNLKATGDDGVVTLTWTGIPTPEANTEAYLRKTFSSVYQSTLEGFIQSRLGYINGSMGRIGYIVYEKQADGSLRQIDFTTQEKFTVNPSDSGTYTYVVKTAYQNFRSNASDGKSVSITVSAKSPIIPTDDDDDDDDDNETNTNTNTNTDTNSNSNKPRP